MSDYTQLTDFSAKDLLVTGDPNKLILGSDIDAELTAIATAITSKYDSTDIGVTVQAYDANTAKTDVAANFTASQISDLQDYLLPSDIGVTVQAYDVDTAKKDVANVFTAPQTVAAGGITISPASAMAAGMEIGYTGGSAQLAFIDLHSGAVATDYDVRMSSTGGTGSTGGGTLNIAAGSLRFNGNVVLDTSDLGVSVQAYDADTAKLDVAANFTAGLQCSGVDVATVDDLEFVGFSASVSAGTSMSVPTQFILNSTNVSNFAEISDPQGDFNLSTGIYEASIAGWYAVEASAVTTDSSDLIGYLNHSGTTIDRDNGLAVGVVHTCHVSAIVYMNGTTDYLKVTLQSNDSSWFINANMTKFSAILIAT